MNAPAPPVRYDVAAFGRICVDFYGEQIGAGLAGATSFARGIGGCAGNVAVGSARLGLRAAIVSRIGDDPMGAWLIESLNAESVVTEALGVDPARRTALAFAAVGPGHAVDLTFRRDNAADAPTEIGDAERAVIGAARALVASGAHEAAGLGGGALDAAIGVARAAGRRVVVDIDWRPAFGAAGGIEAVAARLARLIEAADLVVGTEEEWRVAGGESDTVAALRALRRRSSSLFVVKRGASGSAVFPGAIETDLDARTIPAFPVDLVNPLGAGDAFLAGFLGPFLDGAAPEDCARRGNAAGAIVASRLLCAPSSPSAAELDAFLAGRGESLPLLHRIATRRPAPRDLRILALDHRAQIEAIAARNGAGRPAISRFKWLGSQAIRRIAAEAAAGGNGAAYGILLDHEYGSDALDEVARDTAPALWRGAPVETPGGRPLAFVAEAAGEADLGTALTPRPRDLAVKCLAGLHPDDDREIAAHQIAALRRLGGATQRLDLPLLIEILASPYGVIGPDTVARLIERLAEAGIRPDWWKLEPQSAAGWAAIEAAIAASDPSCNGVLLLGHEAEPAGLAAGISLAAASSIGRGFAIGRAIWQEPAERFLAGTIDEDVTIALLVERFRRIENLWQQGRRLQAAPQEESPDRWILRRA